MAKREKDSILNTSSSFGTSGGSVLSSTRLDEANTEILNTDEDTISASPLRSDLQSGMSADVSGGTSAGIYFEGNRDADTDAGLNDISDTYTVPVEDEDDYMKSEPTIEINMNDTPAAIPTSTFTANSSTDFAATNPWNTGTTDNPSAVDSAKEAVSQAADGAKEQAGALISQAKEQVSGIAQQATTQIKEQLGTQKDKAAGSLDSLTQVIRQTADNLSDSGQPQIGNVVSSLTTKLEDLTSYLRGRDIDEIAGEIQTYARQNPQVVVGGAFLLGIALARFMKASARNSNTTTALTPYNGGNGYLNNSGYATSSFTASQAPVADYPVVSSNGPDYMGASSTTNNGSTTTEFSSNSGTSLTSSGAY